MARRHKPTAKPQASTGKAARGKGPDPAVASTGIDPTPGNAPADAVLTQAGTDTPRSGPNAGTVETPDIEVVGAGFADAGEDDAAIGTEPVEEAPAPAASAPMRAPVPRRPRPPGAAQDPFAVLADYERRSLAHMPGLPEQLEAPGLWRGVGFRLGHKRLASGFDEVVEILPLPPVTPVPGAQPWMLGVANIRGNLLPIVDLKQFLEGERTVLHEGQRVLIVRQPGGDVAITIDELLGQRSFTDEQSIEPEGLAEGRYTHFVDRAYRLGEQAWGIFSLERLARTPEFRQAAV